MHGRFRGQPTRGCGRVRRPCHGRSEASSLPPCDNPPLLYWLIAGSYRLLGVSEASARLAPALASWLTVLGVFLFGRRVSGNRTGLTCAAALLLMPGFVTVARLLIIDGLLTC